MRRITLKSKLWWENLEDSELLDVRLCDLELNLKKSPLNLHILKLQSELDKKGLRFKPHFWISDDWFSPDRIPGVAIPFYLLHPRLIELEKKHTGLVEGDKPAEFMKLIRHEAGHAIQHKQEYAPLNLRMSLVPITGFASQFLPVIMFGGFFFGFGPITINIGIAIYLVLTVFQLVTLPVEFDASKRAKAQLVGLGIVDQDELVGVNKTLDAAAYTYVAAFVSSLGWLLYFLAARR